MKFMLHPEAGAAELVISGEEYKYLIKVRRHKSSDLICFRNKNELVKEYRYRLDRTDGKNGYLSLESERVSTSENPKKLHIGWCLVDPKTIEKTLPMLVELGVDKITFIHCHRSQRNFKLDYERFERIMESSIMQCGRTSVIELKETPSLNTFLKAHPNACILDFGGEVLGVDEMIETVVIGCEGGFDDAERKLFQNHPVRLFASPMILRSETAAVAVASRLL